MAATVIISSTASERQACYALRREVFVDEQNVPLALEIESDEDEDHCTHFLLRDDDGTALGTARLKLLANGDAKAQRVAVARVARGKGVGAAVMRALHDEARRQGSTRVVLSAQTTAIPFYERLGYVAEGPVYDDAGIPHRDMHIELKM